MTSLDKGDSVNQENPPQRPISSYDTLVSRLLERQAQLKETHERRIQKQAENKIHAPEKSFEFLPQLLEKKKDILDDLQNAVQQHSDGTISAAQITKFIDDTVLRIKELQKSFNDASLYLTSFDCEQARLELKNLEGRFQTAREQLLPTKKFSFSNKPKVTSASTAQSANVSSLSPEKSIQNLCHFDPLYSWTNCRGPRTLILPKSDTHEETSLLGQSVYLADLTDCCVKVLGVSGNLIIHRLIRCRIYSYPVAGSVWIDGCSGCDFIVACRQLRIHHTTESRLSLHTASRPIIENSTGLRVAPYTLEYPELPTDLETAGLSSDSNFWSEVEDFSHPNKRITSGSPNWSILPETEWAELKPSAFP